MKKTIKTFGELKVGDKVYSLNYNEWGVLTEHIITKIERNDFRTIITIKGYLKHQLIGDVNNSDKVDLELFALNKSTIGEVAPTKEGVKLFWIQKIESRIECLQNEINELNNRLELEYKSIDKITKIQIFHLDIVKREKQISVKDYKICLVLIDRKYELQDTDCKDLRKKKK